MRIRPAVHAGRFYPDDAAALRAAVERLLQTAREARGAMCPRPRALICPHAGYVYSGPVAASAYCRLEGLSEAIERVLLIGPAHRAPGVALALSSADAFQTPLGLVLVDRTACAELLSLEGVRENDAAHQHEHSLEVQLPFLQVVLPNAAIVPLLAGRKATTALVAAVIERLIDRPGWLVVVSSDLSHFHAPAVCEQLDRETSAALERLAADELTGDRACGYLGISGLLLAARRRQWRLTTVDRRHSGDTAGPGDAVVGYGAYVVC
jgi:AmmeMemoRadiSam system protein B